MEFGDDLDGAAAGADDADSFVGEVVGLVPGGAVHDFAFEFVPEAGDVGPHFVVEIASRADNDIGGVLDDFAGGLLDLHVPFAFVLVPGCAYDFVLEFNKAIGAIFLSGGCEIVADFPGGGVESGPVVLGVERELVGVRGYITGGSRVLVFIPEMIVVSQEGRCDA